MNNFICIFFGFFLIILQFPQKECFLIVFFCSPSKFPHWVEKYWSVANLVIICTLPSCSMFWRPFSWNFYFVKLKNCNEDHNANGDNIFHYSLFHVLSVSPSFSDVPQICFAKGKSIGPLNMTSSFNSHYKNIYSNKISLFLFLFLLKPDINLFRSYLYFKYISFVFVKYKFCLAIHPLKYKQSTSKWSLRSVSYIWM